MNWEAIAGENIREGIRSHALWATVAVFFIFVLVFGRFVSRESLFTGEALMQTNARTFAFFLTFLFVPIVGLLVSYTALHHARNRLAETEASNDAVFFGTVAGRAGLLTLVLFVGFLPAFVVLLAQSGTASLAEVIATFVGAVLFGLLFVAVGVAISAVAVTRLQAAFGAVGAFIALYAWPFIPGIVGLSVPHGLLERFWLIFVFGDTVGTLFALRQGTVSSSALGLLILGLAVVAILALSYVRFDRTVEASA